ncbi:hypothetical protein ACFL0V_03630 [Nanoarchaeota archaeon]
MMRTQQLGRPIAGRDDGGPTMNQALALVQEPTTSGSTEPEPAVDPGPTYTLVDLFDENPHMDRASYKHAGAMVRVQFHEHPNKSRYRAVRCSNDDLASDYRQTGPFPTGMNAFGQGHDVTDFL